MFDVTLLALPSLWSKPSFFAPFPLLLSLSLSLTVSLLSLALSLTKLSVWADGCSSCVSNRFAFVAAGHIHIAA